MAASTTPRPSFMIVGAPKCGTTALYEYLVTHPEVFVTDPKEPHYYAMDLGDHRSTFTRDEYDALFTAVDARHKAVGEASAWYLHSVEALPRIKEEVPDVKLVVMLRNPVEMLRSLHSDLVWICFEDEPDFERAWVLQNERLLGRRIPKLCQVPWFLQYREIGMLAQQARRLLTLFAREQVKFILLDDLKHSPLQVYQQTLAFLGVSNDGRGDFPRANVSKRNRSRWLAMLQSAVVRSLPRPWIAAGKRMGLGMLNRAVTHWNCEERGARPLNAEFHRHLVAEFHDEVGELEDILGRNLGHWKLQREVKCV